MLVQVRGSRWYYSTPFAVTTSQQRLVGVLACSARGGVRRSPMETQQKDDDQSRILCYLNQCTLKEPTATPGLKKV